MEKIDRINIRPQGIGMRSKLVEEYVEEIRDKLDEIVEWINQQEAKEIEK